MNYAFLLKIKGFNFKMNYVDIKFIKLGKLINKLLRTLSKESGAESPSISLQRSTRRLRKRDSKNKKIKKK